MQPDRVVSIVIPVYNERENLAPLFAEIQQALGERIWEMIVVDDASSDGSLTRLLELSVSYPSLRIVAFKERAGQSAALAAGIDAARGSVIATLDADGQNNPADLPSMLDLLERPPVPDAVTGYRIERRDSPWKRFQSRVANRVRDWITGDQVRDSACSLRVFRRSAIEQVPRFNGMHRFLPTLIRWAGGVVVQVPTRDRPRWSGRSKYGMLDRASRGLMDALGVRWFKSRTLRYTVKPNPSSD